MNELKPCHACGSRRITIDVDDEWDTLWLGCTKCGTPHKDEETLGILAARWNRRKPPDTAADAGEELGEINRLAQLVLDELKINVEGKSVSWGNVDKVAGYLEDIAELSEKLAADASAELGRELIAWAAEEENIIVEWESHGNGCVFCDYMDWPEGNQHAPDCPHLRARALEAGDE